MKIAGKGQAHMGLANRLVIGMVTVGVLAACSKSPAAGKTQWAIEHAYADARQAGCVKAQ